MNIVINVFITMIMVGKRERKVSNEQRKRIPNLKLNGLPYFSLSFDLQLSVAKVRDFSHKSMIIVCMCVNISRHISIHTKHDSGERASRELLLLLE